MTTSGALLAATPVPFAIAAWAYGGVRIGMPVWALILLAIATASLAVAGLTISARPRPGRVLATVGTLGAVVLAVPRVTASPSQTLLLAAGAVTVLGMLWQFGASLFLSPLQRGQPTSGRVRGSATVALGLWLLVGVGSGRVDRGAAAAVGVSMLIAVAIGLAWLIRRRRSRNPRTRTVAAGLLATIVLASSAYDDPWSLASCGAVYALIAAVFGPRTERADAATSRWWIALFEHPERMLVTSFATMAAAGAVVLALPQSSAGDVGIGGIDAVFTAVSAVCVTGLVVRDTLADFSGLGQVAILALIQLGGLGIMTFSTAAIRVLGGRMSIRQESAVARLIGARDRSHLIASAQDVLRVTFVVEGIGVLVLAALFLLHGDGFGTACWRGLFTCVSAFCNAGFALQSDSLMAYRDSPLILHVVGLLIVLGGLSPAVVLAVAVRRRSAQPMAAQVKICLLAALLLLAIGFVFFLITEWDSALGDLTVANKIHNAWFQSVTLRTAGFNSVDVSAVRPATYVVMLAMMFIGASPGGTAGGIKTTTAAVLLLAVVHTIRGSSAITVFGRRVPGQTVQRAAVLVTVAILSGVLGLLALLLTQRIPLPAAVFEVVSALGTVGLSQGATQQLDQVGKVVITACMFVGRIGGLSIMMVMRQRTAPANIQYPMEDVDVG